MQHFISRLNNITEKEGENGKGLVIGFRFSFSVLLISVVGLVIALFAEGIIPIYILSVKIVGAGLVFPFLALMFWRRATQKGIIAGMIAGVVVTIGWNMAGNPLVMQAVPGYLSSLVVMIVVSLLTSHAADEQVKALYFTPADSR